MTKSLPKALIAYIEEMGIHALDHLAEKHHTSDEEKGAPSAVVALLVEQWQGLSSDDKQRFVERVVVSIASVIASSARLPMGLRVGAKAVKSAAKVMKKQRKKLKKEAKALRDGVSVKTGKKKEKKEREELEVSLSDLAKVPEEKPKAKRAVGSPAKKPRSSAAKGAAAAGKRVKRTTPAASKPPAAAKKRKATATQSSATE